MRDVLKLEGCKKIAIMGGTFDPIHLGHLVAAEAVRQELGIERVIFVPTGKPPHKANQNVMQSEHRYLMCVLATLQNPYFDVSRVEIDRSGTTYTIDTVKEIKRHCDRDCRLYFITGADAINQIMTWKEPEKLLALCDFVAVTRPGYDKNKLNKTIDGLNNVFNIGASVHFLEVPALAISSTDIRNRVIAGKTIKYLLPDNVEDYILKNHLYLNEEISADPLVDLINKRLHYMLSPMRFTHTQGVASEAYELAQLYGVDKSKAYLAGLLHDCAKDLSVEEKLKLYEELDLEVDDILLKQPDLMHSFLGAELAERDFNIKDEDILNAIRYHTTGRENMSTLEKIIYLADFFEPSRKYFDGIDEIKSLSYKDLDEAMIFALNNTISYNKKKNRFIHPLSEAALEFYKEEKNK